MVVEVASGYEVALTGRLDVSSVEDVRAALHRAIDAGTGDLVVDLTQVELIDATGLGVLLGADRRAKQQDRRLVLRDAPPRVRRILRVTRLHRVLTLDTVAADEHAAAV
ncbi:MAG TPA: STAS domain-containing protein [Actinomycetes bacterium]|jgi:anti-anti-sigma factor